MWKRTRCTRVHINTMSHDVRLKFLYDLVGISIYDHTTKQTYGTSCKRNCEGIFRTKSYSDFVSKFPVEIEYFICKTTSEVPFCTETVTRTFGVPEVTLEENPSSQVIFSPTPFHIHHWLDKNSPLTTGRRVSCPLLVFPTTNIDSTSTFSSVSDISQNIPLSSGDEYLSWDPSDPIVRQIPPEIFRDPKMEQEGALAWDHNGKRSIVEAFECVACYRLPTQNAIWTCKSAHPVCTECLWQLVDVKCPKCRVPYFHEGVLLNLKEDASLTRLYNNIATEKAFECIYSPCDLPKMTLHKALLHDQYCVHKRIPCPVSKYYGSIPFGNAGCDDIVGINALISHLGTCHTGDGFLYFHHDMGLTNDVHQLMQFQFTTEIGNHKRPHVYVGKRHGTVEFCAIMIPRISGDYSESSYLTSVDLENHKLVDNDAHFMSFSIFAVYSSFPEYLKCRYHLSVGPYEHKWPTPDSIYGVRSLEGLAKPWVEKDRSYALCRLKILSQKKEWEAINAAKDSNFLQLNNDELSLSMKTLQLTTMDKSRTTKNGKLYYTLTFALYKNEMPSRWSDNWMDPKNDINIRNTVQEYETYYSV